MQNTSPEASNPIASEIQRSYMQVLDRVVEIEKEEYHSDLAPFSQRENQIRSKGQNVIHEMTSALEKGQKLLQDFLELEEKNHPEIDPKASFARFEEALKHMPRGPSLLEAFARCEESEELPLQQKCGLAWEFMDRAYAVATKLAQDQRFQDAACVFFLLRSLNPNIFEFWLGEANALYDMGKFQEALHVYVRGLLLQPENTFVLYQIGSCYFELHDFEGSLNAFNLCLEVAQRENNQEFVKLAQDAKRLLESKIKS